jgi:hypothetical protein
MAASGYHAMRRVNYCSRCGEQLKASRASSLPFRSFCARCATRFRSARFLLAAALLLSAAIGYGVGRHMTARQPYYLIGSPLDLNKNGEPPSSDHNGVDSNDRRKQGGINGNKSEKACGAPTKSGRPCKRKVAGEGYCWQHRDKFGPKKPSAGAQ